MLASASAMEWSLSSTANPNTPPHKAHLNSKRALKNVPVSQSQCALSTRLSSLPLASMTRSRHIPFTTHVLTLTHAQIHSLSCRLSMVVKSFNLKMTILIIELWSFSSQYFDLFFTTQCQPSKSISSLQTNQMRTQIPHPNT